MNAVVIRVVSFIVRQALKYTEQDITIITAYSLQFSSAQPAGLVASARTTVLLNKPHRALVILIMLQLISHKQSKFFEHRP